MRTHVTSLAAVAVVSVLLVAAPRPAAALPGGPTDGLTRCLDLRSGTPCDLAEVVHDVPATVNGAVGGVAGGLPSLNTAVPVVPQVLGAVPDVRSLLPDPALLEAPAGAPVPSAPEIDPPALRLAAALVGGMLALHAARRRPR